MKAVIALIVALSLAGCITLGSTGWIAMHTLEIGQVGMVAGAVGAVEGAVVNGVAIEKEVAGK